MATLAQSLLASGSYDENNRYRSRRSNLADAEESQRLALSNQLSNQKGTVHDVRTHPSDRCIGNRQYILWCIILIIDRDEWVGFSYFRSRV